MVSRCAAVMMAAAAVADVVQPLPVDLHALDGESEMPESSVSLLQTRMEKMRKSQVSAEAGDSVNMNSKVEGAAEASKAMKEMGDAITSLFSPNQLTQGEFKGAEAIKERAALQSTAIGKASHAIEDVKQAFSKLLAQEEAKAKVAKEKQKQEKESEKADRVSFTQQQDARIGQSSTFNVEAAADFWDDVTDLKTGATAQEASKASKKTSDTSGINIWDDDWKAASNAGSLDVTQSVTDRSYLSQSTSLQAALVGQPKEQKSEAEDAPKQEVVMSWGHDEDPPKNSLLSAKTEGFPSLMSNQNKEDEREEDEESISSKNFETSDEQVVKTFTGSNVAQHSRSIQSILGDMMLSPDDQGMFGVPQEETKATSNHTTSDVQNQTSLANNVGNQSKSDVQNQTVPGRNKTSLASVGRVIKTVIKSVENSTWPWSKNTKPAESSGEILAKNVSNSTKAVNQGTSDANKTKDDAAKNASTDTVLEKSNGTATKEDAAAESKTELESTNKTATQKDTASATKANQTSQTNSSVNDTATDVAASNSTDKK